ncbi:SIR2 family protein [Bradyrhizobium lablabi]|uniref:SIR2 family protein n=1 Tax=Bradyrhizobium lablabi TaxID=722472 RepID=UPI00090A6463|nr:SIR2 family protein [Bradyrhizobium lablabi]SHL46809.1 SIR2-like domain-containing protein [Bradyrhizobium lablabi]
MKFLPNSADIPHDLIRSVNDGDVIFLCGAGVSFGVGLPTFKKLTDDVYATIGESRSHEPAEMIAYDKEEFDRVLRSLEKRTLLHGTESRVRAAVTQILTPPSGASLAHHKSLLQLSRDRSGEVRLLTTNFDTLFERAAAEEGISFESHAGKSIPRPGGADDFGVLHLHGRLGDTDLGLKRSDLILTSADFGDAYLRDGWASRYIEDRMRINTLILVGYRAEDAALRLLLETLDADRDRFRDLKDIYAIEKSSSGSASLWKAKGIKPLEFPDYPAIYATLAEWARYAKDPGGYSRRGLEDILKPKA